MRRRGRSRGECGRGARKGGYEQHQGVEFTTCRRHVDRDPNRVGRERRRARRMFTAFKALDCSRGMSIFGFIHSVWCNVLRSFS